MYICSLCLYSAHSGQKRVLNPLLDLQTIVSHHVDTGNRPSSSERAGKAFNLLSLLSSLMSFIMKDGTHQMTPTKHFHLINIYYNP